MIIQLQNRSYIIGNTILQSTTKLTQGRKTLLYIYEIMESWIYGIIFTLIAAFGSTTGLILQKIAHGVEQANEEKGIPQKNWNGIPCNKYFLCGFLFLGVFPIPFEFLALMYAGQSLILPTGTGCTVIFGQMLAPAILGEKLTKLDLLATAFISTGVVISVAFGTHETPSYSAEELMLLFTEIPFIVSLSITCVLTVIGLVTFHKEKLQAMVPVSARIPMLAFIPSAIGAVQITCFKVLSELTKNTFNGEKIITETNNNGTIVKTQTTKATNEFLKPSLYLYLFLVITLAVQQLAYLNRGLARYNAVKFLPTYNTLLLMVGVANGAIFFKEYTKFHPIFFPIGCLLEISGILALSWKEEEESDEEVKEENKEKATDAGSNSKNEVSDTKGVNNEKKETGQDKEVELATISNPLSK